MSPKRWSNFRTKGEIEKWNIASHISKQRMSHSSVVAATSYGELVSPEGTQDGNKEYLLSDCSHSWWWALWKLGLWKHRILATDSWGAYQRDDFSEPRLLHLHIHRKVLNFLTWDIKFSFINSNLLFLLPALCCKISIYPSYPPRLLRAVFSGLLEMLPPGLEVFSMSPE